MLMNYRVRRIDPSQMPDPTCDWESPPWRDIPALAIDQFHPRSSDHHPIVHARLAHSGRVLHAIFRVQDRFIKSVGTNFQDQVCRDSCVELFVAPKPSLGYFNFEFNCGGTLLLWYIADATIVNGKMKQLQPVSAEHGALVRVATTMPKSIPTEIDSPTEWRLACAIPMEVMEPYIGAIGDLAGQTWRANLYKCADATSHPHWASWSPVGEQLRFHQPDKFGELEFEG